MVAADYILKPLNLRAKDSNQRRARLRNQPHQALQSASCTLVVGSLRDPKGLAIHARKEFRRPRQKRSSGLLLASVTILTRSSSTHSFPGKQYHASSVFPAWRAPVTKTKLYIPARVRSLGSIVRLQHIY
jgi:hypothetical protein